MENKKENFWLIVLSFVLPIAGIFVGAKYKNSNPEFYNKVIKALIAGSLTWIIALFVVGLFTGVNFIGIDGNGIF